MASTGPTLPILILGAGPAGLSLAQCLLHKPLPDNVPFRVFERETLSVRRTQGYRVRLAPVGISSLRELLPSNVFETLRITSGILPADTTMAPGPDDCYDALTGGTLGDEDLAGKANSTSAGSGLGGLWKRFGQGLMKDQEEVWAVDRGVLRKVLAMGLEEKIEWGKDVTEVVDQGEEGVVVRFKDGEEVRGCMVVGADGARTKTRKAVTKEMRLLDTEGRWVFGKTKITDELERRCPRLTERFTVVREKRDDTSLSLIEEPMRFRRNEVAMDLPEDYVYWVIQTRKDYFGAEDEELLKLSGKKAADLAKRMTDHWHPTYKALFELQDEGNAAMLRVVSAPHKLPYWEPSNITLIGDAAHVMCPTAAVGATTAFRDAAVLVRSIRSGGMNRVSIGKYEEEMRVYGEEGLARSAMSGKWLFGMKELEELECLNDDNDNEQGQQQVG